MIIGKDTLQSMIAVHAGVDPYSPYGIWKASFEANAQRATNPHAKRALWLAAARHWRQVMQMRLIMGERAMAFGAYKFARMAVSAARYVE